jgi:dipeptidyl aminopeptidase/acylaminoacyl peptidase
MLVISSLAAGLLVAALLSAAACSGSGERGREPRRAVAPYGTWASPLPASQVAAGTVRFDRPTLDGPDLYWVEGRPSEGGRSVIVRRTGDGRVTDVTPPGFSARTRVHEYGGAAFVVHRGAVFFSNDADQRLYRQLPGMSPAPLTRAGYRWAECAVDARRGRLICVREDQTDSSREPVNTIAAVEHVVGTAAAPADASGVVLVSGTDFYSDPILSLDGTRLAWLEWRHPNMPWDGTELWTAALDAAGRPQAHVKVAGGADESIFQPSWSPDGLLYFVSDRTGWWNLYRARDGAIEPVHPMQAEFGRPQWTFSMATYAFAGPNRLVATYAEGGRWRLALVELDTRRFEAIPLTFEPLDGVVADERAAYFIGASPTHPASIARMSLAAVEVEVLRTGAAWRLDETHISTAHPMTFESDGREVHAFFYAPRHAAFEPPAGDRPPLIVMTHGGPTGATRATFDAEVQYWTTRGFAVVDVNYSGSAGYGRAYRERLQGEWGRADVADAVNAARHLAGEGRVDGGRLIVRGSSAGGYTTLAALTFHDVFHAGASYYGVSDIEVLARDTHKFESRYLDWLIGPYPERQAEYRARSPIHFADRLSSALILFQGLEDRIVPPNQSEMMAEAARQKGLPVAYLAFEGEQHGLRRAENVVRALEAELFFYGAVFGFDPADDITPLDIANLTPRR